MREVAKPRSAVVFCEEQIAIWERKKEEAREAADVEAFLFAEKEIENYRLMRLRYEA